jgi:hypothetical protein
MTLHNFTNSFIVTHSFYTTIKCKPHNWDSCINRVMLMWLYCLSWVSQTLKQNGPVLAEFSPDRVHILQSMGIVRISSSVMWKRCLCSPVKLTLSILSGHEERDSSRNLWPAEQSLGVGEEREVVRKKWGWCRERGMVLSISKEGHVMTPPWAWRRRCDGVRVLCWWHCLWFI